MKKKVELKCKICGNSFLRTPCQIRNCKNNYCSRQCTNKSQIGRIGWNRGLTKETDVRVSKISEAQKGKKKVKLTEEYKNSPAFKERCKKISKAFAGRSLEDRWGKEGADRHKRKTSERAKLMIGEKSPFWKGGKSIFNCCYCHKDFKEYKSNKLENKSKHHKNVFCSKECSANNQKGKPPWNKGKTFTHEHKLKLKEARRYIIFPKKDTSIEVKIQNFLKELQIEFYTHQGFNIDYYYQCDIFIPSANLVIECDGDYWHANLDKYENWNNLTPRQKIQKIKDYLRTAELEHNGYKVLRLWEHEIKKMNLNDFSVKLKNFVNKVHVSKYPQKIIDARRSRRNDI